MFFFFFSSRRRHTRCSRDWSSDVCSSDLESSLIGGIMDDSQTRSLSGIPGLAQIPILGYFFGQKTQDHSQDETVFAITPHIIRGATVSELNQRAIDIGTANSIELHRVSHPAAPAGQPPAAQPPASQTPSIQPLTNQTPSPTGTPG